MSTSLWWPPVRSSKQSSTAASTAHPTHLLLPTGTGIAPYRGFLRRLFIEETPARAAFTGLAWLVLGVPTTDGLLYDDDWQEIASREPERFRLTYAISREQQTVSSSKQGSSRAQLLSPPTFLC